jgi:hypothetical protein
MIPETFADGIGRIGFSEGMVRIELVSVGIPEKEGKPAREVCHRLVMTPQGFMQAVQGQLNLIRKLEEAGVIRRTPAAAGDGPGTGGAPGANGGPRSPNFQSD